MWVVHCVCVMQAERRVKGGAHQYCNYSRWCNGSEKRVETQLQRSGQISRRPLLLLLALHGAVALAPLPPVKTKAHVFFFFCFFFLLLPT